MSNDTELVVPTFILAAAFGAIRRWHYLTPSRHGGE
jgi:hypothetical protein